MNNEGAKKRILAIVEYLRDYTDDKHLVTMVDIIGRLKLMGIHGDRKTISRDFDVLRDFGYDIRKIKHHFYTLYDRPWEIFELQLLIDFANSARFLTDEQTKELVVKIAGLGSKHQREDLIRHANIRAFAQSKTGIKTNLQFLWDLNEAIANRIPVKIEYATGSYNEDYSKTISSPILVEPYGLSVWNGQYYWLGHPCGKPENEIHVYRVSRIRKLDLLIGRPQFKVSAALPEEYPGGHLYLGDSVTIKLKTTMDMLDKIQDIFGERISVHRNVDGSVNVAFKASDNGATINALLSLGSQISLIEPEHAKNRYLDELARILKNYGK